MINKFNKLLNNISKGAKEALHNLSWLFFEQLIRMGISFFVVIWVMRYLGPEKYGTLSYVIAFVSIFSFLYSLGLDNVVIRELVKNPTNRDEILGSSLVLKIIGGIAAFILTIITFIIINPNDYKNLILVIIISFGSIFQITNIISFYFQAKVQSKYNVIPKSIAFILISILKIILIVLKADLIYFTTLIALEYLFLAIGLVISYKINNLKIANWKINKNIMHQLFKDSRPLMLSSVAVTIYMRIDQIMLGTMSGKTQVGIYSAAVSLAETPNFIASILVTTLFPAIVASKKMGIEIYNRRLEYLYSLVTLLGFLIVIPLFLLGWFIIPFLLGQKYILSIPVFNIYIWALLPTFIGVAASTYHIAENYKKIPLYTTGIGCIANVIINLFLIPKYGASGAAIATVISYSIATFSVILFTQTKQQGIILIKCFFRPFKVFELYKYVKPQK